MSDMTVEQLAVILAGFSVGVAAGESYLMLLRRSLRKLSEQRESALWTAPVRVAIPVLALTLAAEWDQLALLGGVAGLLLTQFTAQLSARARSFEP